MPEIASFIFYLELSREQEQRNFIQNLNDYETKKEINTEAEAKLVSNVKLGTFRACQNS